jgi:hypothetical protein
MAHKREPFLAAAFSRESKNLSRKRSRIRRRNLLSVDPAFMVRRHCRRQRGRGVGNILEWKVLKHATERRVCGDTHSSAGAAQRTAPKGELRCSAVVVVEKEQMFELRLKLRWCRASGQKPTQPMLQRSLNSMSFVIFYWGMELEIIDNRRRAGITPKSPHSCLNRETRRFISLAAASPCRSTPA